MEPVFEHLQSNSRANPFMMTSNFYNWSLSLSLSLFFNVKANTIDIMCIYFKDY